MASLPSKQIKAKPGKGASFLAQWGMFFRQFVRHPGMIGSVIPSSTTLVARMLDQVDWRSTRLFVEYGPGVGTFTQAILDRLSPDATLIAIDLNLDFVAYLEAAIDDRRLRVVQDRKSVV
jgi:phospholipid N-methyltransferase